MRLQLLEAERLSQVAPDLHPLLQGYEHELAEHRFIDWAGVLRVAAKAASHPGSKHQLVGLPTLVLDVPLTTAAELAFIRALSSRSPGMLITLPAMDTITRATLQSELGVRHTYENRRFQSAIFLPESELRLGTGGASGIRTQVTVRGRLT